MAPQATPERQPDERPLNGTCLDCGLGFTPRVQHATKCYRCWRAERATQAPVDERSQRRYRHRENDDGTATPALTGDDRAFPLPTHPDGTTPAWRANAAHATTLRLRAARTTDAAETRRLRAAAYDAERLGRAQQRDAHIADYEARRAAPPTAAVVAAISAVAAELRPLVVA